MNFLFTRETLKTLSEIKEDGGYDNHEHVVMPNSRFLAKFEDYDDLKCHLKTIIQSLFQIFNKSLPALALAVSSLFKFIGYLLLMNLTQAKENGIQSLTYLWFNLVITGALTINIALHAVSLVTRSTITSIDGIGRQSFTPSANFD